MTVHAINSLETAADAYLTAETDEQRDVAFTAVEEWIAYSYERDGEYVEADLERMDFASAAKDYLARRAAG